VSPATHWKEEGGLFTFVRNVSTRYVLIVVNALIGLVVLPYNVGHLGAAAYGLWMLTTSITAYFGVLDLGYGGAVVRFVAEYRAKRDARALNEILSTMFYVYAAIGVVCYLAAIAVAFLLPSLFNLTAEQTRIGRFVLLITSAQVALYFPFSVFGGVINGFQQYHLNNVVGTVANICAGALNVLVLALGYGLVELVAVTTLTYTIPLLIYRRNAYKVFPELMLSRTYVRRDRLRELTGFSIYLAVIDWSGRLTYATDSFFIGALINTTAVGVYAVAQRLSDALLRMTAQLHTFLFPAVVAQAVEGSLDGQRQLLIKVTRFQLATAVAMCGAVAATGDVLIRAWVGPGWDGSVAVLRLLAFVVVVRTWMAMPNTVLKGTGHHRYLAIASSYAAVANLLLSIPGTKMYGIVGCAMATVIPATVLAVGFVFPRACRAVGLGVWRGYREIVWPAVWPAFIVLTLLVEARHAVPARLIAALALLACGGLLYAAIFFTFGLAREERRWFTAAVNHVWRRTQGLAAA
jgi:O-antigen/teichoic acid export membrane protein